MSKKPISEDLEKFPLWQQIAYQAEKESIRLVPFTCQKVSGWVQEFIDKKISKAQLEQHIGQLHVDFRSALENEIKERIKAQIHLLQSVGKVNKCKEALKHYADPDNWKEIDTVELENNPLECKCIVMTKWDHEVPPHAECGDIARSILDEMGI